MQNVEIVVNASKELQDREDIQFLIIGDGARREAIEVMASGLKNVTMLPMQPSELATHIYSAAGVNIIPLVAGGTKTAMPSKTGVVLSCGQPVIFSFGGESRFAKMIKESGAGASVDAEDYKGLAEWITKFSEDINSHKPKAHKVFKNLFIQSDNVCRYALVIGKK